MTPQEIFDTVARALIEQGRPSILINNSKGIDCVYRGLDGLKCAAGHLMPNRAYRKGMENTSVDDIAFFEKRFGVDTEEMNLLKALQNAHDLINFSNNLTFDEMNIRETYLQDPVLWMREWKQEMHKVAKKFNLDSAVLDVTN